VKHKKTKTDNTGKKRLTYAAAAIFLILFAAFFSSLYFSGSKGIAKAAIIDQLGSSRLDSIARDENETFVTSAKELLYERFSVVDYYSDNATVDAYKQLASRGYVLIVWRAHSALDNVSMYIAISTTDKDGSINTDQYSNGQLTRCNIIGDPTLYLAITPTFIRDVMTGTFQDTVIVLMTCNGLDQDYLKTAQAFEAKGAKAIISWDNWVGASDNDYGTSLLLQHLISENDTVSAAVGKVPQFFEIYGTTIMRYHPDNLEVANYKIPDYQSQGNTQHDTLMILTFWISTERRCRISY